MFGAAFMRQSASFAAAGLTWVFDTFSARLLLR